MASVDVRARRVVAAAVTEHGVAKVARTLGCTRETVVSFAGGSASIRRNTVLAVLARLTELGWLDTAAAPGAT